MTCLFQNIAYSQSIQRKIILKNDQLISPGATIYSVTLKDSGKYNFAYLMVEYIYAGSNGSSLKIKQINDFDIDMASEAFLKDIGQIQGFSSGENIIELPINKNKQALLRTASLGQIIPSKELIITVVDEFSTIKLQERSK